MNLRSVALVALALGLLAWAWSTRTITHPPGVLVPDEPVQSPPDGTKKPWVHEGMLFTALAEFDVRGRILGTERYRVDASAFLSPVDFALGWGRMSDTSVIEKLSISQYGRFYYYGWRGGPPIPPGEIVRSSSNMHLIPSTPSIRRALLRAKTGQVVRLQGQLVKVEGKDGWLWKSSLSRTDTGAGACEVIWVEDVEFDD